MGILTSDFSIYLFYIFLLFLAIVIVYLQWKHSYWQYKVVVTPPINILFGNIKNVFLRKANLGMELKTIYDEFKDKKMRYCGFYFLTKPVLVVFDLDLIKAILAKDFPHFTDHANQVNEKTDPLSGHLFFLRGQKWKNMRAKLTPTFTSGKIKMMFQTVVECSDELLAMVDKKAQNGGIIDIRDAVGRFTTDVILSCAFGIECKSLQNPNSEFRKYGNKFFQTNRTQTLKSLLTIAFPSVLDFFKIPLTNPDISKFFLNVVKETVNYREINDIMRKDFMHLLIQLKNNVKIQEDDNLGHLKEANGRQNAINISESVKSLTIEQLAAQAFVFFLAGFETSSTTLTFCFYELAANPNIQNALREEINQILEKYDNKITYAALTEMTYMDKCINETLRKYPPLPYLQRRCTETYKVPGSNLVLEKGVFVFIPTYAIQRDPKYYPNPEIFDPERFSPKNKAQRHNFTWLPFGEGPRTCIGMRFGIMETKLALTVLLKNFKFKIHPKTKVPLKFDPTRFLLSPKDGVWLHVEEIIE